MKSDLAGAHKVFDDLKAAGISIDRITAELTVEGVKLFSDSYNQMLEAIRDKQKKLARHKTRVEV